MNGLKSLERALAVLESFGEGQPRLSLSRLSRELRASKATLLRILRTFERHGIVRQRADDRSFVLGPGIIRLGTLALRHLGLLEVGVPHLKRLQALSGETVCLFIVSGADRICVATAPSQHDLRMSVDVGAVRPLCVGAAGKVLLAFMPEDDARRIVFGQRLRRFTRKTITDPAALLRAVEGVRQAGVAVSFGEIVPGAAAIAAPVFDREDALVGAINLLGPQSRMTREAIERLTPIVVSTARALSGELGSQGAARVGRERPKDEDAEAHSRLR